MNRILLFQPNSKAGVQTQTQLERENQWVVHCEDEESARGLLRKQLFHVVVWKIAGPNDASKILELRQLRPGTARLSSFSRPMQRLPRLLRACVPELPTSASRKKTKGALMGAIKETLSRVVPEVSTETEIDFPVVSLRGKASQDFGSLPIDLEH